MTDIPSPPSGFVIDGASSQQTGGLPDGFVMDEDQSDPSSFSQSVGKDLQKRIQMGNQIVSSNEPVYEKVPQYVGKVGAGLANDVIGDAIPQPVKDAMGAVNSGIQDVMPDSYKKAWATTLQPAENYYNNASPEAKNNMDAAGDIVGLASNLSAGKNLAAGMRRAVNSASNYTANLPVTQGMNLPAIPSSKGIFSEAKKAYADADKSGVTANPSAVNDFLNQANNVGAQNPQLLLAHGPDEVTKYINGLNNLQNQPMTLQTAQALDQDLRDAATKSYRSGDSSIGVRYDAMRQSLKDNIFNNPDPNQYSGGQKGFYAIQEGNRLYSQASKAEEIEGAVQKGMMTDVPSTGIKNQMKALSTSIINNGPQGWNQAQVAAINNAAKYGMVTPALKTMGSKLLGPLIGEHVGNTIGGPIGGIVGAGAGYVAGEPFRAAATALQKARAMNVMKTIVDNPKYIP